MIEPRTKRDLACFWHGRLTELENLTHALATAFGGDAELVKRLRGPIRDALVKSIPPHIRPHVLASRPELVAPAPAPALGDG